MLACTCVFPQVADRGKAPALDASQVDAVSPRQHSGVAKSEYGTNEARPSIASVLTSFCDDFVLHTDALATQVILAS